MKRMTKFLSIVLAISMLLSMVPVFSSAATSRSIPSKDEFSTENYVPAAADGYSFNDGELKVVNGKLSYLTAGTEQVGSNANQKGTYLNIDFADVSSGVFVFESDFYVVNSMSAGKGFIIMYDSAGAEVLNLVIDGRGTGGTYVNAKGNGNGLDNTNWGHAVQLFNIRLEVDLGAKTWKFYQNSYNNQGELVEKQLKYQSTGLGDFPFVPANSSASNVSRMKIGFNIVGQYMDNMKLYKKIESTQNATDYDMLVGDEVTAITYTTTDKPYSDMVWTNSNPAVASVNESTGKITALAEGTTVITAKSEFYGIEYTYNVAVKTPATSITVAPASSTIYAGESATLTQSAFPDNTYAGDITWSSSDESIATVDENGVVTAVGEGTATITAAAEVNNLNASATVNVILPQLVMNKSAATIVVDQTVALSTSVDPATAPMGTITWSSSNPTVAEVDENGVVTGKYKGTAVITATSSYGMTETSEISVLIPLTSLELSGSTNSLSVGERVTLDYAIQPADASEVTKSWRSGNHYIATVDKNGVVTAVGEGNTEIYLTAGNLYASYSISVSESASDSSNRKPSLISFYSPSGYSFLDIADMEWAQAAVYGAVATGSMTPDSETVFGAKRNIKRDEFVSVVIKTLGLTNKKAKNPVDTKVFTDVPEDNPYYAEIMKALELGIIQGVSETEFAPSADITRQDMAVVIANALEAASVKTEEGRLDFADRDSIAEYAQKSVRILSKMGIIIGKDFGFDPLANTTRAEVAVIVDRINALR